ncbi:Calcium uptake protein 1-like protein, mitochondrial [Aphelenchoides fujianensis]|nr:Calcium uptake protein 1-like protein, mitochondrial [Aphelenchoides fujianensis]
MLRPTSFRIAATRSGQNSYKPRQGIRTAEDVLRPPPKDEEPATWRTHTIFGKKREDPFFYTDRKAGKGYSNYHQEPYPHRKFIFPAIRKQHRHIQLFCCFLAVAMIVDWETLFEFLRGYARDFGLPAGE